jgi:integrase/recombinase XerD
LHLCHFPVSSTEFSTLRIPAARETEFLIALRPAPSTVISGCPAAVAPLPPAESDAASSLPEFSMQLYDIHGHRKYVTPAEGRVFLRTLSSFPPEIRTFGGMLAHTGCRISEALNLTADRVDMSDGVVVIESLKKRRKGVFRAIPVPPVFLELLETVHHTTAAQASEDRGKGTHLWPISRPTAWRHICAVMERAGIAGLHATPKGLRHGFGIKAVVSSVPLNMTQKWMGHARITTTAIYTNATGPEERLIAERMWAS